MVVPKLQVLLLLCCRMMMMMLTHILKRIKNDADGDESDEEVCWYTNSNLEKYLNELYSEIILKKEEIETRKEIVEKVRISLTSEWPNSEVIVFGSFESRAALARSDIDFTLATDQVAEPKPDLFKVRDILAATDFYKLQVQVFRKRPMIVGFSKQSEIRFDMTIDTPEAIQHASLINGLVKAVLTHELARKMILLIKYWSKVQGICNSNAGTLASIGYNMISIWFLQKKNILPKFSNEEDLPQIEAKLKNHIPVIPSPSLAELLYSFFDHFAEKRNYKRSVMSLRDEPADLQSLGWDIPQGHYFPFQDPFSSARDIGRGVNKKGLTVMVKAFQIAKTKLFEKNDPAELFVEYPELRQEQKQKQESS